MPYGFVGFQDNGSSTAAVSAAYLSPSIWSDFNTDVVAEGLGHFVVQHFDQDQVAFGPAAAAATLGATVALSYPTGIKYVRSTAADFHSVAVAENISANHAISITLGATAGTTTTPVSAILNFSPDQGLVPGNSTGLNQKAIEANISFDTWASQQGAAFLGWVSSSAVLTGGATGGFIFATTATTNATRGSTTIMNAPFTGLLFYPAFGTVDLVTNYSGVSGVVYNTAAWVSPSITTYPGNTTSNLLVTGLQSASMFINGYTATLANGPSNSNGVAYSTVAGTTTGALTLQGSGTHKYGLRYDGGLYLYAYIDGILAAKIAVNSAIFDTTAILAPAFNVAQGGTTATVTVVDFIAAGDQLFK